MKFGSRMDVFLPADAVIHAQVNEKVVAAKTVIATLKL
jgi:phosphatidylserine decarboxylase